MQFERRTEASAQARLLRPDYQQTGFAEPGGELEQIQFLLGHASVQTTERYLGCKQRLGQAVNDKLGLEDT